MKAANVNTVHLPTLLGPVADRLECVRRRIAQALSEASFPVDGFLSLLNPGGGKMLRPALTLLSGQCVGPLTEKHVELAAMVEMIHLASLLHDDVIDQARTRRKQASANVLWGNTQAVLLGDFVLSKAFGMGAALNLSGAAQVLCRTAEAICSGEIQQNMHKGNRNLSESEYLTIIEAKTASLFGACCYLGALAGQAEPSVCKSLQQYGIALGMAFQITDDLLDILGNADEEGKTLGTDLFNEKLTLPVIYWLGQPDTDRRRASFNEFAERQDSAALGRAIGQSDAVAYTLGRAGAYVQQAIDSLKPLPDSPSKETLLGLVSYVLNRAAVQ